MAAFQTMSTFKKQIFLTFTERSMHRFTDALPAHVLPVSHVAFAAVAGRRRNAAAIQAQVGKMLAHIDCRLVQLA